MTSDTEAAIGIFDSGVGGLTVLRRAMELLPNERIVYLGDTARVPYGTRSPETVLRYAAACADLLLERGLKLLVVACNTASACALEPLRESLEIPVIGVVEPGARVAVESTRSGRVGVIGTAGTIQSGEYLHAIERIDPEIQVSCKACPLFVPLAEEGWTRGDVPTRIAREYLAELIEEDIDTLVLGCTHYPLLKEVIADVMGPDVRLVDSAEATARVIEEVLDGYSNRATGDAPRRIEFLVSDAPEAFARVGRNFLAREIERVEWVDF